MSTYMHFDVLGVSTEKLVSIKFVSCFENRPNYTLSVSLAGSL